LRRDHADGKAGSHVHFRTQPGTLRPQEFETEPLKFCLHPLCTACREFEGDEEVCGGGGKGEVQKR
jgi:hypothetical protein